MSGGQEYEHGQQIGNSKTIKTHLVDMKIKGILRNIQKVLVGFRVQVSEFRVAGSGLRVEG